MAEYTDDTCGSCKFWASTFRESRYSYMSGECRRYAPREYAERNGVGGRKFPITLNEEGCGDWERDLVLDIVEDVEEELGRR